ncbi:MAG: SpoIIE family protein phosphatase [Bryobacteraceae bacterium]|nr:SpoIIE family protein phosphatase [Bryobacteraceae bacterium]
MLARLIDRLFPGRLLTVRERRLWLAAILMAPLALLPGLFADPPAIFGGVKRLDHDRAGLVAIARKHLSQMGVSTEGWSDGLRFTEDIDVERYLLHRDREWAARLRKHAPAVAALITFRQRDGRSAAEVYLDIHGNVTGHSLTLRDSSAADTPSDRPPLEIAQEALASALGADLASFRFPAPEISTLGREGGVVAQRFVWRSVPPGMPELEASFRVDVRGARPLALRGELKLDPQYAAAHRPNRAVETAVGWFFVAYIVLLSIAVLVRYFKRTLQKEISHVRTFGIAAFVGTAFFLYATASDQLRAVSDATGAPLIVFYIIIGLVYLIMGLLIGAAYAASEGELRELYPGKLTSLDSVLSNRPLSRNAAASVILGVVVAAWMVLLYEAIRRATPSPPSIGGGEMLGLFVYSRFPNLVALATLPIGAIMESLTLLLPLAIFQRFFKSRRALLWVVAPLALVASLGFTLAQASQAGAPLATGIMLSAIKTAGLFAAFFWVDLLAAIVTHSVFSLVTFLLPVARITPSGSLDALLQGAIALVGIAVYIVALFRARPVRDEEVRPLYARFLAERLSLESEVAAAREAQLRLLPVKPPEIDGLSISAICKAADEVGGDYYDFFKLGPRRLALVVSDGGRRGLATALSIAVAKGYLMEKAQASSDPIATLCSLRTALGDLADPRGGFCFAIIDAAEGMLRYARTGDTPRVLVEAGASLVEAPSGKDAAVIEGSARLSPSLRLVFYTDGLSSRLARASAGASDRWLQQVFAWHRNASATELGEALVQELFSSIKGPRAARLDDDLTLIVIRAEGAGAHRQEQVA